MRIHSLLPLLALGVMTAPALAWQAPPLSVGPEIVLEKALAPELPTVLVFFKPSSTLEAKFFQTLQEQAIGKRVGLKAIHVPKGDEPVAKQFLVTATPTAIVFDRRGRETGRSSEAEAIGALVEQAGDVARIDWMKDDDPRFAEMKRRAPIPIEKPSQLPGILRTMSLRPDVMMTVQSIASRMHFSNGALTRREKEMVAAYVSALNKCKY